MLWTWKDAYVQQRDEEKTHVITSLFAVYVSTANKGKILYGLLKEPDINIALDDDDDIPEGEDKPKVSDTMNR